MSLQNEAMLVSTTFKEWGARKKDKKINREAAQNHGIEEHLINTTKKLLHNTKLDEIKKLIGQARQKHYHYTSPWFDNGTRILSSKLFLKYTEVMSDFRIKLDSLVDDFSQEYDDMINQERVRFSSVFNEKDYPVNIKEKFGIEVKVLPIPMSSDFRINIRQNELDRIKNEMEQEIVNVQANATKEIWSRLHKLVANMAERLENPERIFDSLTGNLKELIDIIPGLNITGNQDLENMRLEVSKKLTHWSKDSLKNEHIRKDVQKEAATIAEKIASSWLDI